MLDIFAGKMYFAEEKPTITFHHPVERLAYEAYFTPVNLFCAHYDCLFADRFQSQSGY